ncbi:MAG TPA: transposase [Anaeromyxobacteraceae bacterium]|nr:transposase [Anaeromyxobacteraceae bacterium]
MTVPRQILPGSTYLITRRCAQRQFLLRPSKLSRDVFLFVLAVAARRFGIQVHAYCVMSNHLHMVITDMHARLPAFAQFLNAFVARALNASMAHWESFWAPGSYSAVRLVSPEAIVAETAYVLANPVSAGLVRFGRLWPGAWSDPDLIGAGTTTFDRPARFFAANGTLPATADLELTPPPGFTVEEFRRALVAELERREQEGQQKFQRRGFVGVAAVLKQKPTARPRSKEPRRNLSPRIAARDTWKRIEALTRVKEFVRAYRAALLARRAGSADVVFPAGTYLLRVAHGVRCAASG